MTAQVLPKRLRLLRVLHAQPHRYSRIRWITQGITLGILYLVPLLGLARYDLWAGRHLAWRKPLGPVYGFGAVVISVLSLYLVTFTFNAVMGRVFCGFGCPVGQMSRLGEDAEIGGKTRREELSAHGFALVFALAFATAGSLWFVSPRVFVDGSALAITTTIAVITALAAALWLHGRHWRWRFCEGYCPIGTYYSAVVTNQTFGIHFDTASKTCKACGSCDLACPVGLEPRDLTKPKNGLPGIGIDGFPGMNHCLCCGECVRACENQYRKEGRALVPLCLSFAPALAAPNAPAAQNARTSSEQTPQQP
jgi:polyferredoxin